PIDNPPASELRPDVVLILAAFRITAMAPEVAHVGDGEFAILHGHEHGKVAAELLFRSCPGIAGQLEYLAIAPAKEKGVRFAGRLEVMKGLVTAEELDELVLFGLFAEFLDRYFPGVEIRITAACLHHPKRQGDGDEDPREDSGLGGAHGVQFSRCGADDFTS